MAEWIVGWIILGVALAALVVGAARLIGRDGYGLRPAPSSTRDWTAHGLPSRPYGV